MKKLLTMLLIMVSVSTVAAQDFSWGVKAGANLSTMVGSGTPMGMKFKADFTGGVFAEYQTCNWFGVSAELLYSGEGANMTDVVTVIGDNSKLDGNEYHEFSYLNVPILANFHIGKNFAIKAGIQPGFLLDARQRINSGSHYLNDVNKFGLSIPVGIAYTLNCGLLFDLRYSIGITDLYRNMDKIHSSNITFTIGWKF